MRRSVHGGAARALLAWHERIRQLARGEQPHEALGVAPSVFTRSPGARGIDPGATTRTSRPRSSATLASANPAGPASYTARTGHSRSSKNTGTTFAGSPRSRCTRSSPVPGSSTATTVCAW
ncbi:MAG TPA: hypothetical protein VGN25_07210 [Solirubrobacteraceae bacterium]|nr:hypothetical protein [Solirubrobacteraceae bacterium]